MVVRISIAVDGKQPSIKALEVAQNDPYESNLEVRGGCIDEALAVAMRRLLESPNRLAGWAVILDSVYLEDEAACKELSHAFSAPIREIRLNNTPFMFQIDFDRFERTIMTVLQPASFDNVSIHMKSFHLLGFDFTNRLVPVMRTWLQQANSLEHVGLNRMTFSECSFTDIFHGIVSKPTALSLERMDKSNFHQRNPLPPDEWQGLRQLILTDLYDSCYINLSKFPNLECLVYYDTRCDEGATDLLESMGLMQVLKCGNIQISSLAIFAPSSQPFVDRLIMSVVEGNTLTHLFLNRSAKSPTRHSLDNLKVILKSSSVHCRLEAVSPWKMVEPIGYLLVRNWASRDIFSLPENEWPAGLFPYVLLRVSVENLTRSFLNVRCEPIPNLFEFRYDAVYHLLRDGLVERLSN